MPPYNKMNHIIMEFVKYFESVPSQFSAIRHIETFELAISTHFAESILNTLKGNNNKDVFFTPLPLNF